MPLRFFQWFLLAAFMAASLCLHAGDDPVAEASVTAFDALSIRKKGIRLAELFRSLEGKNVRIRNTKAMRFDAAYVPADNKPFNLPIGEVKKHVDRAHAVVKAVKDNQAFTSVLNGKNIELPIGIKKSVGNKEVIVCLDSIVFTPTYGYAVMYAVVEDTKNNRTLAFWGKDIRFTREGGFTGDGRLELLQTYDLSFGPNTQVSFLVDQSHQNYLVFDCDGFRRLHVDARISFSRNMFVPENPDGSVNPSGQVTAGFMTDITSLDNFLVQVSDMPAFQVRGLEGISFRVGTLAFDYSSVENPKNMIFPAGYSSPDLAAGAAFWEGFYISNLEVNLPEEFKLKKNTSGRIKLAINNAIIDRIGFTGKASVQNLLPLSDGDMNGWNYSLDLLSVEVVKSTPVAAEFSGQLVLPVTKDTEKFSYNASIQPDHHYNFAVKTQSNLSFPLWGAGNVQIYQDSWIKIEVINKKFLPMASLSGKMDVTATINGKERDNNTGDKGSNLSLAEIDFTKVIIKTTKPYLSLDPNGGAVSFGSPKAKQLMARLPITLSGIGIQSRNNGDQLGVKCTVNVNLVGEQESGGGFSGSATITVWGESTTANKFSYYRTELNRIDLNKVKIAVLTLAGWIEFYRDDPYYGSGFAGSVDFSIDLKASTIGVKSKVMFGKKPQRANPQEIYRYWFVDALASFPAVPLVPPLVYLNALGGGASYRMGVNNDPAIRPIITSLSGVKYVPNEDNGLGLRAMLGIQGQRQEAYNGEVALEILFQKGGGLKNILFSGFVQFVSLKNTDALKKVQAGLNTYVDKAKKYASDQSASARASDAEVNREMQRRGEGGAVTAQWMMEYDRERSTFSADIGVFVNVFNIIKGVNSYDNAGTINLLVSPSKWYLYVGKPQTPVGLKLTDLDLASIRAYLVMGSVIPGPLPLPNGKAGAYPSSVYSAGGSGFGFGARLWVGVQKDGTFYYKVGVDTGFDIFVMNVAGKVCRESGRSFGINNWYGIGQAYLYVIVSAGFRPCITLRYPCCWKVWKSKCWCKKEICTNLGASLTSGFDAQVRAPRPIHAEVHVYLLGFDIPIRVGTMCSF